MSYKDREGTMQKVTNYLFSDVPDEQLKNLDIRTIIDSPQTFRMIARLGAIDTLGSDVANSVKTMFESLFISMRGIGRTQGVEVMKTSVMPKIERLYQAVEPSPSEGASE